MKSDELRKKDIEHIWHPYTNMTQFEKSEFPIITRAEGCYLYDADENKLFDGIASWWCVNFGHSHPRLVKAIKDQAEKLQHVILGGASHSSVIALAEKLAEITPDGLEHCFFASDGSSVVEASLRMAIQYWDNCGESQRKKFVSLKDGYHGDTLGAVSVGYVDLFHKEIKDLLPQHYRAESPHCAQCPNGKTPEDCDIECFQSMKEIIVEHHREIAAVIVEPLCQGAAGIRIYKDEYLIRLRKLCDQYNLLLIADEIAVGFGRTGAMFACERAGISPDIMTVGKGLTGGYLPLSAAVVNDRIYQTFSDGKIFYHGHTFCGNPIATALANEALALYEDEKIVETIQPRIQQLHAVMTLVANELPNSFMQTLGMIGMIELSGKDGGAARADAITRAAYKQGLLIRPLGSVLYLWPPLVITEKQLQDIGNILMKTVRETA